MDHSFIIIVIVGLSSSSQEGIFVVSIAHGTLETAPVDPVTRLANAHVPAHVVYHVGFLDEADHAVDLFENLKSLLFQVFLRHLAHDT